MKKTALLIGLFLLGMVSYSSAQDSFDGHWKGDLSIQGQSIGVVFHFSLKEEGWTGSWDMPLQAAYGIPFDSVSVEGEKIYALFKELQIEYDGTINEEGTGIVGNFYQMGFSIPLSLERTENTMVRPQEPKPPYSYKVKNIEFENVTDSVTLAGTLTYPKTAKGNTAVVLLSGSGAQNRDEELFGHKPFLLIADNLTRAGIVVLRYDDRGYGESTGDLNGTTEDFARDADAAVNYLQTLKQVDPQSIYLIGHSEGALIASMLSAQRDDIKGSIFLGGPALKGSDLLMLQGRTIAEASGQDSLQASINVKRQKFIFDALAVEDEAERAEALDRVMDSVMTLMSPGEILSLGENWKEEQIAAVNSPWIRYFINCDPMDYLPNMNGSCLALFGDLDLQVPLDPNATILEDLFKDAQESDPKKEVKVYKGLNHLFQNAETGLVNEYGMIEETMEPKVLMDIIRWIKAGN